MTTESNSLEGIQFRQLRLGLRSRLTLTLMRLFFRPIVGMMFSSSSKKIAKFQLLTARMRCPDTAGLPMQYQVVDRSPGHVIGSLDHPSRRLVLWLHGGGFVMPAAPAQHLVLVARLCRALDADGFVPDYRLAPGNPYPAALDDCEAAYRSLLDAGFAAGRIVLGGDSAGGNLVFGLLQRIRKAGLPMPACVVPISPVTEMARGHAPPSRPRLMKKDPLLSILALPEALRNYVGGHDNADPELSPLYMDCAGLPPTFFLVSSNEILLDDSLLMAQRMIDAGVSVRCEIWPHYPHAFPLFESLFPEVAPARQAIVDFASRHLQ